MNWVKVPVRLYLYINIKLAYTLISFFFDLADPAVSRFTGRNEPVVVGRGALVHVLPIAFQIKKRLTIVASVRFKLEYKYKCFRRLNFLGK